MEGFAEWFPRAEGKLGEKGWTLELKEEACEPHGMETGRAV